MLVLPIQSIREEDGPIIGPDCLNLARLAWLNLPVADGVIVTPPTFLIQTMLSSFKLENKEIFEQKLTFFREKILSLSVPEELEKVLGEKNINLKKLWHHLLIFWLEQLRSKIWREGFSPNLSQCLSAQPLFFTSQIKSSGQCFFDYNQQIAIVNMALGTLSEKEQERLPQIVKLADQKLLLPQIYDFVVEEEIKIVKVSPVTQYPQIEQVEKLLFSGCVSEEVKNLPKSALKIYLDADDSFRVGENLDGFLVQSEKICDFDQKILQLVEFAHLGKEVIYKLFDDPSCAVRGVLSLIHDQKKLQQEVEVLNFLRNKKNLTNIALALPLVRSADEFINIKNKLSNIGIKRSALLKFYLEFGVVENLINLDDYLKAGIDGVLLNLDSLASWIGGFDWKSEEAIFYQKEVKGLEILLQMSLKLLTKQQILVLAYGNLALDDRLLSFLVENGCYGIIIKYAQTFSIQERLLLIEQRMIRSRTT